ncbi:nuclear pore complex Nup85-like protein [Perilla frutescens var. hirtella]|nr:nuclear pore complex Nup85-like protein [Perilla frutescens var. frutescens]KAH6792335.1 nuclear pore complex Nup85-like protein [Perilla frutescens var. hirtella]
MPGVTSDSGEPNSLSVVPHSLETQAPRVYPLRTHRVAPPFGRLSISWARGNTLRVSLLQAGGADSGGEVVEAKLTNAEGGEIPEAQRRRIAYGSVTPFALLQSRKNPIDELHYDKTWWVHVMEYSKEIKSLLGDSKSYVSPTIEDPKTLLKKIEEPTSLRAAWELMELFYADKQSQTWIPERLIDWLADFDCLLSATQPTVHTRLVAVEKGLVTIQAVENDPEYWEAISSALAVGWLDIVVKMLRLHGSYQLDQLGSREIESGLVEAVALLISQMPRLRPHISEEKLGECYNTKPEFMKAWDKWRAQITKLDCHPYWLQCDHQQTRVGLKNMIQIMLGNASVLSHVTYHWIELYISHLLYIRPFTVGLESMHTLAQKCMHLKPITNRHKLMGLLVGILEENTEVVLAECSRSFGPWMITHAVELLTAGSAQAEMLLHEEQSKIGGLCIEELHRLTYAQILSSHALTWNIAPIYLTSCMKQGLGLLENLLYKQPVQHHQVLLKSIEICRLNGLEYVSQNMMKIAGVHFWKHGKKGSAVFWLQQAQDEVRLNRIAKHLFDFVGKSVSNESFKQWEGMIELLGTESRTAGGLEFLKKYRDFRRSLQQVQDGITTDDARKAAEALVSLMRNPSTPPQFWLHLLYDSLRLLNWKERPLLNVSQTNLLLSKLQELSLSRLLPGYVEADLPPEALKAVRLALAANLGRAILEE